jgi:hypothetical protein
MAAAVIAILAMARLPILRVSIVFSRDVEFPIRAMRPAAALMRLARPVTSYEEAASGYR